MVFQRQHFRFRLRVAWKNTKRPSNIFRVSKNKKEIKEINNKSQSRVMIARNHSCAIKRNGLKKIFQKIPKKVNILFMFLNSQRTKRNTTPSQ